MLLNLILVNGVFILDVYLLILHYIQILKYRPFKNTLWILKFKGFFLISRDFWETGGNNFS